MAQPNTALAVLDPNRPHTSPPSLVLPDFDPGQKVGCYNWLTPNELIFDNPDKNLSFTREQYAAKYHVAIRYEYCMEKAKDNKSDWTELNKKEKWNAIMEVWKGLQGNVFPRVNSGQTLLEKYFRETAEKHDPKEGALQVLHGWMEEHYGKAALKVAPLPTKKEVLE